MDPEDRRTPQHWPELEQLVRYAAEELGISEEEAWRAVLEGKPRLTPRLRARRAARRGIVLLLAGLALLVLTLGALHLVLHDLR